MYRFQCKLAVGLAAGAALLAACGDAPTESGVEPTKAVSAASQLPAQAQDQLRPGEARFRALSRQFPEFGGFYFDDQGDIVVQLTNLSRGAAVRAALAPVVRTVAAERARAGGGQPAVRFNQAAFSFTELSGVRDRVFGSLFELDGVTMLDVNERENRVVVGLADEAARPAAEARVRELGVPRNMLSLKVVGRGEPLAARAGAAANAPAYCSSVQSYCRPLIGGIKITFNRDGSLFVCSIGFPAIAGGYTRFVTAAHCSDDEWNLDYVAYFQPDPSYSSTSIGNEAKDPNGVSCGFMSAYVCRYSDANFVAPAVATEVGYIIRPIGLEQLSVSSSKPHFVIAGQRDANDGERVYVVGQTTGLHTGTVQGTCQDWKKTWEGRYHAVRCSDVANYNSSGGDSGGPVFLWDGVSSTVTLVGVNFARNGTYDHAIFSPVSGIARDLGSFEARAPEYRGTTGGGDGDSDGGVGGGSDCGPYAVTTC